MLLNETCKNSQLHGTYILLEFTWKLKFSDFLKNFSSRPKTFMYRKVASSNTSRLEAHAGFFQLLMKGIFDPYVLWTFDKKLISWLVMRVRTCNFSVSKAFFILTFLKPYKKIMKTSSQKYCPVYLSDLFALTEKFNNSTHAKKNQG